ncbi:MAG: DUF1992 domain-containing protein [Desulfobacteraceae bacterium]|jgi:hypothetical protein
MFPGFEKIIEERIQKAQKRGDFDNLKGAGKPIHIENDLHIPQDLRLAHKILKNADCLPPEIELKKEIQRTEDLLAGIKDTAEKYRVLKKLNYLILKLNSMRSASTALEMPQHYLEILAERIESKDMTD